MDIFNRLSGHGDAGPVAGAGGSSTEPLRNKAQELLEALDDLAAMVTALNYTYQAESTERGVAAIKAVSDHVKALGNHAETLADAFDEYAAAVHTTRGHVPEPVPFANEIDVIQVHSPGLLAHIPVLAQLEEEHNARTREAQAAYAQLDQVAVRVDDATSEFDRMHKPTTTTQVGVITVDATTPSSHLPSNNVYSPPVTPGSPTPPAGSPPAPAVPAAPPPVVSGPAPTPGAGGGTGPVAPLPSSPGSPGLGAGEPGAAPGPGAALGRPGGAAGRFGPEAGSGFGSGAGNSLGRGPGPDGGRRTGNPTPRLDTISEASGVRGGTSSAVGRGVATAPGGGFGPIGTGGRREEDQVRRRPSYLEEAEDPAALFGIDQRVAPPVIGVLPPR